MNNNDLDNQNVEIQFAPLTEENPSEEKVQLLIQSWLDGKAIFLAGNENADLSNIIRPSLITILRRQRDKDIQQNQFQVIEAIIKTFEIVDRNERRIEANALISYKDKRVDQRGDTVSETVIPSLKVKYILSRQKDRWQLIDFSTIN